MTRQSGAVIVAIWMVALAASSARSQEDGQRPQPENYDQWRQALDAEAATAAESLRALPDFEVQLLRSARPGEGSWISMAFDPEGRLTVSREDQGLLRLIVLDIAVESRYLVPHPPEPSAEDEEEGGRESISPDNDLADEDVEAKETPDPIPVEETYDPYFLVTVEDTLKECRGLLYAYGALYANANNSKGLYRLRDNDRDGRFEEVTLLRATPGGVGHGRNDLALGPDGLIYSIHGNDVQLPKNYELGDSPYRNYQVDALLPCEWNKYLFNAGATVPAGHVVRTDAEGKLWEVVAGGMRNPYGIAFSADGEAFTYDADMEWDAGAPWYRPTRVHHLVSGADYGWRQGTGKWPAWMPESLPANLDVGLGSPTAVEFGTRSNFPEKYRRALFINEWAYGRIIAVHLTPAGATYECDMETFIEGRPLNVTDLTFGPDGHMYFITGGRKTQSGLYRVKWGQESFSPATEDEASTADTAKKTPDPFAVARAERRRLEEFHGVVDERAIDVAWDYLDSDDLWLRHAARIAIECQPVETWKVRALAEKRPTAALTALLALTRVSEAKRGRESLSPAADDDASPQDAAKRTPDPIVARLAAFPLNELTPEDRLIALRTYQLAFIRLGPPDAETAREVAGRIEPHFPSDDPRADRLACELLVYLNWPAVIAKTVALLEGDRSQTEKLHYLFCLRHVKDGWTMAQRKTFFHWLRKARGFDGAQYVPRFVHYIEQDSLANLTPQQKEEVLPILTAKVDEPIDLGAGREVVKDWKLIDFVFSLDKIGQGRDFERGKRMFHVARCSACHKLAGEGKAFGPDLTDVAKRFSRRDMLVSILSPSAVIADKFQAVRIVKTDGKVIAGLVISEDDDNVHISADPLAPEKLTTIAKTDIEEQSPSPVSTMPEDLLNTLELEEILDLLAYMEAGGDAGKGNFRD